MDEKEVLAQRIIDLKTRLESRESDVGDWKILKCYEAKLKDQPAPYDVDALLEQRAAIRKEINELEAQLV